MPESDIEVARRAWQVLAAKAALRATITYSQLKDAIAWTGATQAIGRLLNPIYSYCQAKGLPDITILAVRENTGRPSYVTVDDVDKEREKVLSVEWFKVPPPSAEELREFLKATK